MRKPIFFRTVLAILLLVFIGFAIQQAREQKQLQLRDSIELKSREAQLIELDNKYTDLLKDKSQTVEEKSKRIKELEKEKERLEKQVRAKQNTRSDLQTASTNALNELTGTNTASAQSLPKNGYKSFIYQKESGNNPLARNSIGCLGIGQACPGSKLLAVCPTLSDYACQDRFFTNYAMERYGSWQSAYNFWLDNSWW